jgi:hypothetical protein
VVMTNIDLGKSNTGGKLECSTTPTKLGYPFLRSRDLDSMLDYMHTSMVTDFELEMDSVCVVTTKADCSEGPRNGEPAYSYSPSA